MQGMQPKAKIKAQDTGGSVIKSEAQIDVLIEELALQNAKKYLSKHTALESFLAGAQAQRELSDKKIKSLTEKLERITADRGILDGGNIKMNEVCNALIEKLEHANNMLAQVSSKLAFAMDALSYTASDEFRHDHFESDYDGSEIRVTHVGHLKYAVDAMLELEKMSSDEPR